MAGRRFYDRTGVLFILSAVLLFSGSRRNVTFSREGELMPGADTVLLGGKIWTGTTTPPGAGSRAARFVQAIAIANGRILGVGSDAEIERYRGLRTKVVQLEGRLAVPGLIDSHVHFIQGGFQLLELDLKDAQSEEELARRVSEKAKTLAPGRWLEGGDWDEQAWEPARLPTRQLLDRVTPNNPVVLSRYDGHAVVVNSLALRLAGITRATPDPVGGVIVRDKATEPTGVLKDAAEDLVAKVIPPPTQAEMVEALRAALLEAARVGLTSVQDITADGDSWNGSFTGEIELLRRAELEGCLTCRMYEIIPILQWQKLRAAGLERDMGDDFIKLGAVKGFADGSLGSATAGCSNPMRMIPQIVASHWP